jgi:hypothetical protein
VDPTAEEERAEEECGLDSADVEEERGISVEEEQGTGVEEERGAYVESHAEDTEEGVQWRADAEEGRAPMGVGK